MCSFYVLSPPYSVTPVTNDEGVSSYKRMWEFRHYDSTSMSLYAVMAVVKLLQRLIRKAACMDWSLADNLPRVPLVDKGGAS